MSLGQNIYRLRTSHDMSQLALAEALGVSRQSISKWETDASVPELDKLVKLSELFGVTIDELIKGEVAPTPEPPQKSEPETKHVYIQPQRNECKTAGIILLCMGFLVLLLLSIMGAFGGGLIFSSPFIICGIICLTVRRLPGLWCAWAVYFIVSVYLQYATGITWAWSFNAMLLKNAELSIHIIVAFSLLAAMLALVLVTAYCLRGKHIDLREGWKKPLTVLLVISAVRVALHFLNYNVMQELAANLLNNHFVISVFSTLILWLRVTLVTAFCTLISRCIVWKQNPSK